MERSRSSGLCFQGFALSPHRIPVHVAIVNRAAAAHACLTWTRMRDDCRLASSYGVSKGSCIMLHLGRRPMDA
ncbi:uncharacterized protein J3R85_019433 [Psidium guajava]|nr:uncharacterized protein J3R85_019433 [Psidium guajava]